MADESILNYLSRAKCANIKLLDTSLEPVDPKSRFDGNRFDFLAASNDKAVGIKVADITYDDSACAKSLLEISSWLKRYGGTTYFVDTKKNEALYEKLSPDIEVFVACRAVNGYIFRRPEEIRARQVVSSHIGKPDTASILTNPKVIDYALRKLSKKSEIFSLARVLYSAYRSIK